MLGEDTFRLRTALEDLLVRVERFPGPLSAEQQALAARAVLELRFGLEGSEPGVVETAQRLASALLGGERFSVRGLGASLGDASFAVDLMRRLEEAFLRGRLVVERPPIAQLSDAREISLPELPPLPATREPGDLSFELRLLDEIGKAISGVDTEFSADGPHTVPTNPAGVALLEGIQASSASVSLLDPEALAKVLDPRWEKFRPGKPPKESNMQEVVFRGGELGPFSLKAAVPNTVVIKPPLGKLFVELFDKTGRVRHVEQKYTIAGPMTFEGTTDEEGRLLHELVFPGDYTLSLTLEFFEGDPDEDVATVESALVVLDAVAGEPQVRLLGAAPFSILARLHMFFNTNKTFLLPSALPSVQKLRTLYADNTPGELLVVGHADTKGGDAFNDKLSLERAEATIAFLKDDVDGWFKFYGSDIENKKRWGKVEDRLMIISMPDFVTKPKGEDAVEWFQRTRKLDVDGIAGPNTRKKLIAEYMSLDGASLEETFGEIEATAHGCGENFPLDDTGEELDEEPEDEKRDPGDRRVELFFFDAEFGITPKPPAPNSKPDSAEYPKWRERVAAIVELRADDLEGPKVTFIELVDALFRTNSAVVLPEGETPTGEADEQESLTSVGVFATALRFIEGHPEKTLLIAGHCDTTATVEFNQKLSEERARSALALLIGGEEQREAWKTLCDERHTVADYKQILAWADRALTDFDCDPGKIDDVEATGVEPVRRFQKAYNRNKAKLGAGARPDLVPDGDVGPLTWGAIFDCYEFALQDELGEDASGVRALRDEIEFVDEDRRTLGFSEHFPIEELGVDNFRSQANRRVEILFFDPGEEPDTEQAADDPETSDLYLPGNYARTPITPLTSAKDRDFDFRVHDEARDPLPNAECTLIIQGEATTEVANEEGIVTFKLPPICPESVQLVWQSDDVVFQRTLFVECNTGPVQPVARARLENLGYPALADIDLAIAMFQRDYQLSPLEFVLPDGSLPPGVVKELASIWIERLCDATLP